MIQLVDIYNTFCKALDDGKEVCAILCDISKTFDKVWHKILCLICKLQKVGISEILITDSLTTLKTDNKESCNGEPL